MSALRSPDPGPVFPAAPDAIVEISLLLPTERAEALLALARRRRESVGQILRQMIDIALTGESFRTV